MMKFTIAALIAVTDWMAALERAFQPHIDALRL
jgi:hypothetical protein